MQSFLSKLVKNHPHRHHHHLSANLHRCNTLQSLPKPRLSSQPQQLVHVFNRITPPLHHSHFRGFLSNRNHHHLLHFRSKLPKPQFHRRGLSSSQSPDLYHGWRSWFNRITADDMVHGLIIANVAVFLLWGIADNNFMINNFAISLDNFKSGRLHTLITNAFSHRDIGHIVSNMIGLYFFGKQIGKYFGPGYLLKLYLAGAVGGSIFYLLHKAYKSQTSKDLESLKRSRDMALGASAAVNAIVLLYIFLNPHAIIYIQLVFPVPAYALGALYIGKDMFYMLMEDSKISGSAHLGGAVVAAIAWARIRKRIF